MVRVAFLRSALIVALALTLSLLSGSPPPPAAQVVARSGPALGGATAPADFVSGSGASDLPIATIGLRHQYHQYAGSAQAPACDKDIDLTGSIAGVTAIAAQNNIICATGEIDTYKQDGELYAVQAGGLEAAFTITRIAAGGTPSLIDQEVWPAANTYAADVKAFRQGSSRYVAVSLERYAAGAGCGVAIFKVTSAPATPLIAQASGGDWCDVHNSFVEDDANGNGRYLYLTADLPNDMRVLDIGNLNAITEIGRYTHPQASNNNFVHDMMVVDHGGAIGRRVYVSYWDAGLMVLDADHVTPGVVQSGSPNQPLNPNFSIDPAGFLVHDAYPSHDGTRVFIEDEYLRTAGTQAVQMWNISSPATPSYVAGITLGSALMPVVAPAHNLLVQGHCLYVGWYKGGLQAFRFTPSGFVSRFMHHQAQTETGDDLYDGAWNVELATLGSLALLLQSDRRYGLIVDSINGALNTDGDAFADVHELRLTTDSCLACPATSAANDEWPDPWALDTTDNGFVDTADIASLSSRFSLPGTGGDARYDLNLSGFVDTADIAHMTSRFGEACAL